MEKFTDLYQFIDRAIRSRKYPQNTGGALKSALKLFETEINDDERNSLESFKANFEQIYRSVCTKNSDRFSVASLATYRNRILKVIKDYEKYGVDPTKMVNWTPKIKASSKKNSDSNQPAKNIQNSNEMTETYTTNNSNAHRLVLALRPDFKFILEVPMDISFGESKKIKAVLDSLVIESGENAEHNTEKTSDK